MFVIYDLKQKYDLCFPRKVSPTNVVICSSQLRSIKCSFNAPRKIESNLTFNFELPSSLNLKFV
jgi:hypothetical protein